MSVGAYDRSPSIQPVSPEDLRDALRLKFDGYGHNSELVYDGLRRVLVLAGRVVKPRNPNYENGMLVLQQRVDLGEPNPDDPVPLSVPLHRAAHVTSLGQQTVEYRNGHAFYLGADGTLKRDDEGAAVPLAPAHYVQMLDLTTSMVPEYRYAEAAAGLVFASGLDVPGAGQVSRLPRI